MEFDVYWNNLIRRVYDEKVALNGPEELVYRLTCIYGETMVDGVEAYFERRYDEYDEDIAALNENGFSDIAADFEVARQIMFGDTPLTEAAIAPVLNRLLEEDEELTTEMQQIGLVYDRLTKRLPELLNRRDEIGIENGQFELKPQSHTPA